MDKMESDMALEVPDTPDRFARPVNPSSSGRKLEPARTTYARRCRDFGRLQNLDGSGAAPDDNEFFFRQATLARMIPESSPQTQRMPHEHDSGTSMDTMDLNLNGSFSFSHSTRCRDTGRKIDPCTEIDDDESCGLPSRPTRLVARSGTVISLKPPVSPCKEERPCSLDGSSVGLKGRDKREGIDLFSDSQPRPERVPSRSLQLDAPQRNMARRKLVRGGCISPVNRAKADITSETDCQIVKNTIEGRNCVSFAGITYQDKGKGLDLCTESQPRTGPTHRRPLQLGAPPRSTGHRKLVRNGCISQSNIARSKNATVTKEDEAGDLKYGKPVNEDSSRQIHIVSPESPDSEGRCADKKKKQVMVDGNDVTSGQHATSKFQSSRECLVPGKEVTVIVDIDGDTVRSEDIGRRTAHEITALQHGSRATSESDSESKRDKILKGKRKYSSIRSPAGECSGSTFDDTISYVQSSHQPSYSKPTISLNSQQHGTISGPVIEIDEMHSPEALCSNPQEESTRVSDDVNARSTQVEADEILARQLQEKYYNESPVIGGTEEMDATIALSLQEEDARRSISRLDQFHSRDAPVTHQFARPRNYSARSTDRTTSSRMAQLRRNLHQRRMGLVVARLNLEREPASDNDNNMTISNRVLRIQRDFNENDYEMLVALDENNRHGGASESQINSLPQSVVETDNLEEPCVVCLEPPLAGDIIRHLPCLHKFHKECIDEWLRTRRSCPICKSGIT